MANNMSLLLGSVGTGLGAINSGIIVNLNKKLREIERRLDITFTELGIGSAVGWKDLIEQRITNLEIKIRNIEKNNKRIEKIFGLLDKADNNLHNAINKLTIIQ